MGSMSACAVTEKSVDVLYERGNWKKPDLAARRHGWAPCVAP